MKDSSMSAVLPMNDGVCTVTSGLEKSRPRKGCHSYQRSYWWKKEGKEKEEKKKGHEGETGKTLIVSLVQLDVMWLVFSWDLRLVKDEQVMLQLLLGWDLDTYPKITQQVHIVTPG